MRHLPVSKAVVALSCACLAIPCLAQSSWSTLQGNAAHSGYVPVALDAEHFDPLWEINFNAGSSRYDFYGPTVAIGDGKVFLTTRDLSTRLDRIAAHDLFTGNLVWAGDINTDQCGLAAPAFDNGVVYAHAYGHSSTSGPTPPPRMLGYNSANGQPLFSTAHSGQWSSGGTPTPYGGAVYAAGGYYGGLDAYNGATGQKLWFRNMPQQYGWTPAADEQHLYVYLGEASASPGPNVGRLYVINRATGALDFEILDQESSASYGGSFASVMIGTSDNVLAINAGRLHNFDLGDKTIAWQRQGSYSATPAVAAGAIYAPEGRTLSVIDEASGQLLWSWDAGVNQSITYNVVVTDNLAFVSTSTTTHAIDLATHQTVWSTPVTGSLALADHTLVITRSDFISTYYLALAGSVVGSPVLTPTADALADRSPAFAAVVDGHQTIDSLTDSLHATDRSGLLTFDISQIPDNAHILSAALLLDVYTATVSRGGDALLLVDGYADDGTLDVNDLFIPENLIGQSNRIDAPGLITINLDLAYIESLLTQVDHLGLNLRTGDTGLQTSFVSLQGSLAGMGLQPRLSLRYEVIPEPSISLLLITPLILRCSRRPRRA
ncbi:MAG: PQQ-binding-like beta-propeller repeat protein [Phycisphaeraceae bacterium]|nr:PQQ-binding-like beta-propeller repeat protein [Phycisphaeraceae bacterium]